MIYSDNLKEILMQSNHKFIYGESKEREIYLKSLVREYGFQAKEVKPVGIYIKDPGLEECHNKACDIITTTAFNSRYFEMLVAYEVINKLMKELSQEELEKIEPEILYFFNMVVQDKFKTLEELRQELLRTKEIYYEEYTRYIKTAQEPNILKRLRIMFIFLDSMARYLKDAMPNIARINLFIDKDSTYSDVYTRVINFYINARSNKDLSINVGCESYQDWATYRDVNGNFIQNIHDYQDINMQDFALVRKKEME